MIFRFRVVGAGLLVILLTAAVTYAQATSTFNGRILDQGDAVLPGVTVTVTSVTTGVARTSVTNDQGQYSIPGLETGTYEIKADLSGFAPGVRSNVRLDINSTLTVDFRLALAGLTETLTVTGEAPLIETSQSKVANTIETTEVQNLPMITRTISGMLELLPGARTSRAAAPDEGERRHSVVRRVPGRQRGDERGWRRQPGQPLQRTTPELHHGKSGAVSAGIKPVQRR